MCENELKETHQSVSLSEPNKIKTSKVFQKFENLLFIQREILGSSADDDDDQFRLYALLLHFRDSEIEELRKYVLDEMLYRGMFIQNKANQQESAISHVCHLYREGHRRMEENGCQYQISIYN